MFCMGVKRIFLVVLDSLGVGALPDAADFKDEGANTIFSISKSKDFNIPMLKKLGIGCIEGIDFLGKEPAPLAAHARLKEMSAGKDTTTGHWEISGIITEHPMPTFPGGFPPELISSYEKKIGLGTLCGLPYSGTDVIRDYGEEHISTGKPIIYTSADSVFQIAAHEAIIPPERLYEYCRAARELLVGKWGVGRVIARPFTGKPGDFVRTDRRRDFSLLPPKENMLTSISNAGMSVIGIGKISDIFAGVGISESRPTHGNTEGMDILEEVISRDFSGLCFLNLVDFDMKYGHRQDADGYAAALSEFDTRLRPVLNRLREDDCLIITADHGCDPSDSSTDHTREYIPALIYGSKIQPMQIGTRDSFADIGKTICALLGVEAAFDAGRDFSQLILKN